MRLSNLTGKRFGMLTVIESTRSKRGKFGWHCKCDCGNFTILETRALTSGNTRSCGCLGEATANCRINEFNKQDCGKNARRYTAGTVACKLVSKPYISSKTQIRGVSWDKRRKAYRAYISFKGNQFHLGFHSDLAEATKVRKEAEQRIWGEFLDWYNNEYKKQNNSN